ncbi:hypothetical protein Strop_2872 [Salinispora tropica CNB-440]|uniref:Uncharacterized protein n=1 Tax=Salinispora tropica (strain ATCC BAA-916 / DSM 44818 / JCM 13857 / NBRC 105044 / CNB-440) TaxID=369723 RepID=A4X8W2_SALTO|nr:hypothetical protein Strop_2872 [Salinispora tropica CNB-440]
MAYRSTETALTAKCRRRAVNCRPILIKEDHRHQSKVPIPNALSDAWMYRRTSAQRTARPDCRSSLFQPLHSSSDRWLAGLIEQQRVGLAAVLHSAPVWPDHVGPLGQRVRRPGHGLGIKMTFSVVSRPSRSFHSASEGAPPRRDEVPARQLRLLRAARRPA